jgi:hypothetical protein
MNRKERRALARKHVSRTGDRKAAAAALKPQEPLKDVAPRLRDLGNGAALTESGLIVPSHVGK